jgi:hypothetical protein
MYKSIEKKSNEKQFNIMKKSTTCNRSFDIDEEEEDLSFTFDNERPRSREKTKVKSYKILLVDD